MRRVVQYTATCVLTRSQESRSGDSRFVGVLIYKGPIQPCAWVLKDHFLTWMLLSCCDLPGSALSIFLH